jgi:acetolactate synthase-1/2/3 large subunit
MRDRNHGLTDLSNPQVNWTQVSEGLGVPSCRVETVEGLRNALETALVTPGPYLIEAMLA